MSNQSPEEFVKTLPVASTVPHDISSGEVSLPPTALLGEAERRRLEKLAASGEQAVERPPADKEQTLELFEDGATVKWLPRPGSPTQCLIVDASGKHLAIARDENIADFICNSINTFVVATSKNNDTDNPIKLMHPPIEIPSK